MFTHCFLSPKPGCCDGRIKRAPHSGSWLRLALLLFAIVVAFQPRLVFARSAPPPPVPIKVMLNPGVPTPGVPVNISWTIPSFRQHILNGVLHYYINSTALPPPNQPATGGDWAIGQTYTGPQNLSLAPGINHVEIAIYKFTGTPTADKNPPLPTQLAPGETPKPASPKPTAPNVVLLAYGEAVVNTSSGSAGPLTGADRKQVFADYAPLLLYSYDHDSDEKYAPIDVLTFIKGSTLQADDKKFVLANSALQAPAIVLDPAPSTNPNAGTISAASPMLPAGLYVSPLPSSVQQGLPWQSILAAQPNPGLYGHAVLLDFKNLDRSQFETTSNAGLLTSLAQRYGCSESNWSTCPAQVLKIEYWQFFGYSHDYDGQLDSVIDSSTDHTGDWCTVQLYVDASWWRSGHPDGSILAVYHYMHGIQVGFDMSLATQEPSRVTVPQRSASDTRATYPARQFVGPMFGQLVDFPVITHGIQIGPEKSVQIYDAQNNTVQLAGMRTFSAVGRPPRFTGGIDYSHPVVYVEWGGHEFWPTPTWGYTGASKHNGTGQYSYFGVEPVDLTVDSGSVPDDVRLVTSFLGYWGAKGGGGPPQGPILHCQWYWDPASTDPGLLSRVHACVYNSTLQKTY